MVIVQKQTTGSKQFVKIYKLVVYSNQVNTLPVQILLLHCSLSIQCEHLTARTIKVCYTNDNINKIHLILMETTFFLVHFSMK